MRCGGTAAPVSPGADRRSSAGVPLTSDPVAVTSPDGIYTFALSTGGHAFYGRLVNGVWSGWTALQGSFSSDLAAVSSSSGVHVFGRGTDGQIWGGRLNGTTFTPWSPLGGSPRTVAAAATASGVYLFHPQLRRRDLVPPLRRNMGRLAEPGGELHGCPIGRRRSLRQPLRRGTQHQRQHPRQPDVRGSWTGWQNLRGNTNASPVAASAGSYVSVFVRGFGDGLWHGKFTFGWGGFQPLGGTVSATDALYG